MRRVAIVLSVALLPLSAAWAQTAATPQAQPHAQPPRTGAPRGLQGEAKLRYIIKQLDLDKDQKDHADALVDIYKNALDEERANGINRLQEVRVLWVEMEDAKKAGDQAKVDELMKQLENYRTGVVPEREFFEGLESILTPEQKPVLAQVRERLKANPEVQLTPADVLKTARDQKLTPEQEKKLVELQEELRSKQTTTPGADAKVLDDFIGRVRGVLTPEQAATFDKQIEKMRPDATPAAATGTPVVAPAPAPAPPKTP